MIRLFAINLPEPDGRLRGKIAAVGSEISTPFGVFDARSVVSLRAEDWATTPPDHRVVMWSGSHAQLNDPPGNIFEEDPRTWGPKGWGALDHALEAMVSKGWRLCIRPHARHIVSDIPGCVRLVNTWAARGVELLADPASMLTAAMFEMGTAEDVLTRAYEVLATEPFARGLAGVVVANAGLEERAGVVAVPLNRGLVDPEFIARLVGRTIPEEVPRVLIGPGVSEQVHLLNTCGVQNMRVSDRPGTESCRG